MRESGDGAIQARLHDFSLVLASAAHILKKKKRISVLNAKPKEGGFQQWKKPQTLIGVLK